MTHILIPIKEIENRILTLENLIKIETKNKQKDWETIVEGVNGTLSCYKNLLKEFKQISLDINDIEKKAEIFRKTTSYGSVAKYSYQQALWDLKMTFEEFIEEFFEKFDDHKWQYKNEMNPPNYYNINNLKSAYYKFIQQ